MKQMVLKVAKLTLFASFATAILSFYGCAKAGIGGPSYTVDGIGNGAQVAPITSSSTATGSISGHFDGTKNTLTATLKWSGLSGPAIGIHLHGFASPGKNNIAMFVMPKLPGGASDTLNFVSTFTESQEHDLVSGLYYYDIHTTAYPNGEIRGQILLH